MTATRGNAPLAVSMMALGLALAVLVALPSAAGTPAAASSAAPAVERLAGSDRFATADAIADESHPDGAATVYVATGADFPDALASGPAAAAADAPVLLVRPDAVPAATAGALETLGPEEVVVLGGPAAVAQPVLDEIRELTGAEVRRVEGSTRFDTAAALAVTFEVGVDLAYVASGRAFPDALAGGAAGAALGAPLLLVEPDGLPASTRAALDHLDPARIVVLGGPQAVDDSVVDALREETEGEVERIGGADRVETAIEVARDAFGEADAVWLARADAFPDALAGAPAAGLASAPVLLSDRACLPDRLVPELDRLDPTRVVVLGGEDALGTGVAHLLVCGRETTVVAAGLEVPWDVAFTPDGRVFVTERDRARLVEIVDGEAEVVQTFSGVDTAGEGGLLGLTPSPDHAEDGLLYAYLTSATDNRVVRFRPGEEPEPVLTGIPRSGAGIHHGGRLAFGPDGLLYVTTGDAQDPARAQDPGSLAGKILRVTADGDAPAANPDAGSPRYALGLRNPQGLAWAADGALRATEFGPGCDDEVNAIVSGGNYGWPDPCGETRAGALAPLVVKQPPQASWSGATMLVGGSVPEWEGDLLVAALRGRRLWRFAFAPDGALADEEALLVGDFGRLRHVAQAPDGSVWVLTSNRDGRGTPAASDDRLVRIGPLPWR